jgi:uncharacterized protein with HEPN domain
MSNEINTWLLDIQNAISEIESFLPEEKDFNTFKEDLKTRRAIERNLEIIGEAMNRILSKDDTITILHARKIVDTRNRIVHGYDSVSEEIIWSIVLRDIPALKVEIMNLISGK